jgi:hypothetical protein
MGFLLSASLLTLWSNGLLLVDEHAAPRRTFYYSKHLEGLFLRPRINEE